MIPRSMLTAVLEDIDVRYGNNLTHYELSTHIISGLYKAMRQEETPKPVLLMAACEVLDSKMVSDPQAHELVVLRHLDKNFPHRTGGQFEVFFKLGETASEDAHTLCDALLQLADQIA